MRPSILVLVAFVAVGSAIAIDLSSDKQWNDFKTTFKKTYPSHQEEQKRQKIFADNLQMIRKHNYEADLGKKTYRLGMNQFGDLTTEEFAKKVIGKGRRKRRRTKYRSASVFLPPANTRIPDNWDWRQHGGYVTKVKDQTQECAAGYAYSAIGALEGQYYRKTLKSKEFSAQQIIDCSYTFHNYDCNGGDVEETFEYIKSVGGIETSESYPYKAEEQKCHFNKTKAVATVTGYSYTPFGNETALKIAVATIGPVTVLVDGYYPEFQFYKSGIYNEKRYCKYDFFLDTYLLAVGYGTKELSKCPDNEDYWILKNSWGTSWGMDGYILLRRNYHDMCGVGDHGLYPVMV